MEQPGLSMVQIAKRTQREGRELAAKVNHVQVPAYYDQIVGDLILCRRARSRLKARSARLKRAAAKRASSAGAEGCGFASEPAADCKLHPLEQRGPVAKVFKLPPCDAADLNDVANADLQRAEIAGDSSPLDPQAERQGARIVLT